MRIVNGFHRIYVILRHILKNLFSFFVLPLKILPTNVLSLRKHITLSFVLLVMMRMALLQDYFSTLNRYHVLIAYFKYSVVVNIFI